MKPLRHRWTARMALAIGVVGVLAAVVGIPIYLRAEATPLHPDPATVRSVMPVAPDPQWAEPAARARAVMRTGLSAQNLPGVSVAVGVGGRIVWAEGFGWADLKTRAPVTPDTQFRIGTASAMLTSAAVGALVEANRLRVDDPIQVYVPQFPQKQWPLTVRELMAHVAGVATDSGNDGPLFRQRCERPVDALPYFANGPLLFQPGTQYRYSTYGWILVSAAVEAAAGRPFLAYMHGQVFQPLGMDRTGAESSTEENPDHIGEPEEDAPFLTFFQDIFLKPLGIGTAKTNAGSSRATFYAPRSDADPRRGVRVMLPHNVSCYSGSMAFLSTPSDLVRFGLAINNGTLLRPATRELLQTSSQLTSGQQTGQGLGWDLDTVTLAGVQTQMVGQEGQSRGGRVVSVMMFRDRGLVVAVMSNVSHADTSALGLQVAEAFVR